MGGSDVPGEEYVKWSGGNVALFNPSIPISFIMEAF